MPRFFCLLLLVLTAPASHSVAERMAWGNLTGRFVYSGVVPPKKMLSVTKDQAVFGHAVPDLSLLVHGGNSGVEGVRSLLPERPGGCFAQKTPDPFLNHAWSWAFGLLSPSLNPSAWRTGRTGRAKWHGLRKRAKNAGTGTLRRRADDGPRSMPVRRQATC